MYLVGTTWSWLDFEIFRFRLFKEVEYGFGFLRFFILQNFRFRFLTVLSKFEILVSSLEIWMFRYEWILEDKLRNKTFLTEQNIFRVKIGQLVTFSQLIWWKNWLIEQKVMHLNYGFGFDRFWRFVKDRIWIGFGFGKTVSKPSVSPFRVKPSQL